MRKPKTAVGALKAAMRLIGNKKRWTTGNFAVNKHDVQVDPLKNTAIAWCALGSLQKVDGPREYDAKLFLEEAALKKYRTDPATINDILGHRAVMTMFRHAIKRAERAAR